MMPAPAATAARTASALPGGSAAVRHPRAPDRRDRARPGQGAGSRPSRTAYSRLGSLSPQCARLGLGRVGTCRCRSAAQAALRVRRRALSGPTQRAGSIRHRDGRPSTPRGPGRTAGPCSPMRGGGGPSPPGATVTRARVKESDSDTTVEQSDPNKSVCASVTLLVCLHGAPIQT
jgi:hypothetical protein